MGLHFTIFFVFIINNCYLAFKVWSKKKSEEIIQNDSSIESINFGSSESKKKILFNANITD